MVTRFSKKLILINFLIESFNKFCLNMILYKLFMSVEELRKSNTKNFTGTKFHLGGSASKKNDPKISNFELNKIQKEKNKKQNKKICINNLQNRLRKKEVQSRNENRILYGLFISAVAVLFFAAT